MTAASTALDPRALHFASGLPGFPEARRFVLVDAVEGAQGLFLMRSADVGGAAPPVEFVVAAPRIFFPDYAPEIDDATVARLALRSPEDTLLLVILTVGTSPATATANLIAPIVVNVHTHEAVQAVLTTSAYSVKTPLNTR
jgi:flagellar assembly factor FliW